MDHPRTTSHHCPSWRTLVPGPLGISSSHSNGSQNPTPCTSYQDAAACELRLKLISVARSRWPNWWEPMRRCGRCPWKLVKNTRLVAWCGLKYLWFSPPYLWWWINYQFVWDGLISTNQILTAISRYSQLTMAGRAQKRQVWWGHHHDPWRENPSASLLENTSDTFAPSTMPPAGLTSSLPLKLHKMKIIGNL